MRTKYAAILGLAIAAGGGALVALGAPDRLEVAREEFKAAKRKVLIEAGNRHAKLGTKLRDAGLVQQATREFVEAVEVSEGENAWAKKILDLMQRFDERFWKTVNKKPSKQMLASYDKWAKEVEQDVLKDRLRLAKDAAKKGLVEEAYGEYVAVVRGTDEPLRFDAEGRVTVEGGSIPAEVSKRMKDEAISVNDALWLRDEFLARIPAVRAIFEAETATVRVRSMKSLEQAKSLVGISDALIPYLEEDLGGRPTKKLNVFVFADRKTYETYLDAAKLESFKAATGMADCGTFTTLVLSEGLGDETIEGVTLHEMSHVYQFGVTRAILPSWYCEGFAETWGGDGTFTWDGKTLRAGGKMAAFRLDPVKSREGFLPLSELLGGDALDLINKDKTKAMRFYAQSWALRTFLRGPAGKETAANFERWETFCRGASLGAEAGKPFSRNTGPAAEHFRRMVAPDLAALEKPFQEWLASQ
jgi:hypothetical protein